MARPAAHGTRLTALLWGALLLGCPPPPHADRPDAQTCTSTDQCNPAGATCGELYLCVQNVCAASTVEMVCPDASGMVLTGNCSSYLDCNGGVMCGPGLVSCAGVSGNTCDTTGPTIDIPCPDAGPEASVDAAVDGRSDAQQDGQREGG